MNYQPPIFQDPKPLITLELKLPKQEPPKLYKIVANDNLSKIAEAHQTTVQRLWEANTQLTDPNHLEINQELTIPLNTDVLADRPMPVRDIIQPVLREVRSGNNGTAVAGGSSIPRGSGRFQWGWCTYLADQLRPDIGATGNAGEWIRYSNGTTPRKGAIAVNTWAAGGLGHVAYVLDFNDTQVLVRHMNYPNFGVITEDWIDLSYWAGYIY